MYNHALEKLLALFGYEKIVLCQDCLSVTTLDNLMYSMCSNCGAETDGNSLVFEDAEMMVDFLEAHDISIYGVEVCEEADFPIAVMNMCMVDMFLCESMDAPQTLSYSLGVA